MGDFLDIYTLVFLALAIFVIFRLRAVLGQRTGNERPPFDPFQRPEPPKPDPTSNVIPLPTGQNRPPEPALQGAPPADVLKGVAEPGTPLAAGLSSLMAADRSFEPRQFVSGARAAYEMIVLAFARGDRKALKDLLSPEVYDSFVQVIADREQKGEKVETTFVSIDRSDIVDAELKGAVMHVAVKFASKLITSTKDAAGKVIEGSPDKIVDLVDVWTFAREANSPSPAWALVSTAAED